MEVRYRITSLGNVSACRTEIEIEALSNLDNSGELVAVVFEDHSGVRTDFFGPGLATPPLPGLDKALDDARRRLKQYVNRRGENAPGGLTRAGLSMWLLEKYDGTAMGAQFRQS